MVTSFPGLPVAAAGTAAPAVPTVTIEDVDAKLEQQKENIEPLKTDKDDAQRVHAISDGAEGVPGQLPAAAAPTIPDWYKIGWRAVGGQDAPEGKDPDKHVLAAFVADQYFGDWYHNAAIIVVVCTLYTSLTALVLTKPLPAGHRRHPLPYAISVWLGLDFHSYGILFHLLLHLD
jgi:hypothetical protein